MNRLLHLTLVVFFITSLVIETEGRKRRKKKGKGRKGALQLSKPVTCGYLDNCFYPIHPTCVKDFNVRSRGRTVLYTKNYHGLQSSGTKHKDDLGALLLYSGDIEILEVHVEMLLARRQGAAALMSFDIFRY